MKPSTLKAGNRLIYRCFSGEERVAYFVRRSPARNKGFPAKCYLRFPDFAGLSGPDDDGTTELSDYHVARNARFAENDPARNGQLGEQDRQKGATTDEH